MEKTASTCIVVLQKFRKLLKGDSDESQLVLKFTLKWHDEEILWWNVGIWKSKQVFTEF